jgi:hypothetical protein
MRKLCPLFERFVSLLLKIVLKKNLFEFILYQFQSEFEVNIGLKLIYQINQIKFKIQRNRNFLTLKISHKRKQ